MYRILLTWELPNPSVTQSAADVGYTMLSNVSELKRSSQTNIIIDTYVIHTKRIDIIYKHHTITQNTELKKIYNAL